MACCGRNCYPDVIFLGTPLVDTNINLNEKKFLDQNKITLNSKQEISWGFLLELIKKAERCKTSKHVGGSALNTCRLLRGLDQIKSIFLGSVGTDENGKYLRQELEQNDVNVCLQDFDRLPTGQCLSFCYNGKTAICRNLAASAFFSLTYFMKLINEKKIIGDTKKDQIIYIEGFFVDKCLEIVDYIANKLLSNNKLLALNLSAPFVIKENLREMIRFVRIASFIFGNLDEMRILMENLNCETLEEVAGNIMANGRKLILITNGPHSINLFCNFTSPFFHKEYCVPRIPHEEIVDAVGVGDAFVAGFLNAYLIQKTLDECVTAGTSLAKSVMTVTGCELPTKI